MLIGHASMEAGPCRRVVVFPHVKGTGDRQMAQQVGIDRMRRTPCTGVRLAIQDVDPHPRHLHRHAAALDRLLFASEYLVQPPAPCTAESGVVRRVGASSPDPPVTPGVAGSRPWSGSAPGSGMAAPGGVCGFGRSARCAQPSCLGERPCLTIRLQRALPTLDVMHLEIRLCGLGLCGVSSTPSTADAVNGYVHAEIWFGGTSTCSANSANVWSPGIATKAT
jgi:hypothetical protein